MVDTSETRPMKAKELIERFHNPEEPNLIDVSSKIFASGSMDTEKAFFRVVQKYIDEADSDPKIAESLVEFRKCIWLVEKNYKDFQDGHQERVMFTHVLGYLFHGDEYLYPELDDNLIEEIKYFLQHGQIRDRILTHTLQRKGDLTYILNKQEPAWK